MAKQISLKRVVDQAAADVKKWPAWMRNEPPPMPKPANRAQETKPAKK